MQYITHSFITVFSFESYNGLTGKYFAFKELYLVISWFQANYSNGFRCSTAMALNVAIVTTFSLPKEEVVLAVSCYIVGFYAWLFYLAFEEFRSRGGRPTDENNDQALKYLELHTPLDSIMRNY